MANGKSIGVAYADPQFESLIVTGATEFQGGLDLTGGDLDITTTSDSTNGSSSVEPVLVSTTMTGAGGVGGGGERVIACGEIQPEEILAMLDGRTERDDDPGHRAAVRVDCRPLHRKRATLTSRTAAAQYSRCTFGQIALP
jgi:hypothetical protein